MGSAKARNPRFEVNVGELICGEVETAGDRLEKRGRAKAWNAGSNIPDVGKGVVGRGDGVIRERCVLDRLSFCSALP